MAPKNKKKEAKVKAQQTQSNAKKNKTKKVNSKNKSRAERIKKQKPLRKKNGKISINEVYPKASTKKFMSQLIKQQNLPVKYISSGAIDAFREIISKDSLENLLISYNHRPKNRLCVNFSPNLIHYRIQKNKAILGVNLV